MMHDDAESQPTSQGLSCPSCGEKGKAVKPNTIECLLTGEAKARVLRKDGFRFCPTPTCEIGYFHPDTGQRFLRRDVRVPIWQKEVGGARLVCYCFNHTVEEIEAEVAKTGTSQILDEVARKCRQGLSRCDETNPQGSCCLGNVQRVVRDAQTKFGKAPAAVPERDSKTVGGAVDCCGVEGSPDENQ